jgi:hypothetical protein
MLTLPGQFSGPKSHKNIHNSLNALREILEFKD